MSSIIQQGIVPIQIESKLSVATINTTYENLGTPTNFVARSMLICSSCDNPVILSFDGINDDIFVPIGSSHGITIPLDFATNNLALPKGTQIRVKAFGGAVANGFVTVTIFG